MKKVFYSLAFVAIVSILSSCSQKPEEMLAGTWTLSEVNIEDIDMLAQTFLDLGIGQVDAAIAQVEEQIAAIGEETKDTKLEKEALTAKIEQMKAEKGAMTLEAIKDDFSKGTEALVGTLQFVFNEDKTYKSLPDGIKGTWALNEDATSLTITEGDKDEIFIINNLSSDKLDITVETGQADMPVVMKMTFTKGEVDSDEEATDETTEEHKEEGTH